MFKLSEIKDLIKLLDQTSVQELEIEQEGFRLLIRKPNKTESIIVASPTNHAAYAPVMAFPTHDQGQQSIEPNVASAAAAIAAFKESEASKLHKIVSPMVGTFYEAASPGAPIFVKKGDKVNENSVVCIVEAMKLMNEIEAEIKGEVVEILVENGQLVEYGQPLFLIKPE